MAHNTKAAVVAIGSELVSGQITNRNAAWISSRLFEVGIDTVFHLTVDDINDDIVKALEDATKVAGLVFLTGGLGPTSDDLTRQAIARFAGKPLCFDPGSWAHIEAIFSRFSNVVPETNRQQCFFPEGASIFSNTVGTANAFKLSINDCEIWALPGPPREIETVWHDHVASTLPLLIPPSARKLTRMWRTVGKGESHIAELIEPIMQGKGVDIAYRAHAPYIETKLRFLATDAPLHQEACEQVEMALAPFLYERDRESAPYELAKHCMKYQSLNIYDGASQGHLLELLGPHLREQVSKPLPVSFATSWESHEHPQEFVSECLSLASDAELAIAIAGFDASGDWALGLKRFDDVEIIKKPSFYKGSALQSRNVRAIGASAIRLSLDLLKSH